MTISVTNRSDAESKGKSLFLDMFILSQGTNASLTIQFLSFVVIVVSLYYCFVSVHIYDFHIFTVIYDYFSHQPIGC